MKNRPMTVLTALVTGALIFLCGGYAEAGGKKALEIVLVSDLNDAYGSTSYSRPVTRALELIAATRPDLVLCAGDMVAGQSRKIETKTVTHMWDAFKMLFLAKIDQHGIPFAFTFGNHDGAGPGFVNEREMATSFWQANPPNLHYIDRMRFPQDYSFLLDGVFFAVIDVSSPAVKNEQIAWLTQQLMTVESKNARLRVVMGHLPLYAVAEGRNKAGDVVANADALLMLFEKHGVDYYISGHHHAFYPAKKGNVKLVCAGCLGGGPRRLIGSRQKPVRTLTMLSLFPDEKEFRIRTCDMSEEPREIQISDLPAAIDGFNGTVHRYP